MSIILAEAEKSRLINVFQTFAMNIYESRLTCLQKSDGIIWVCTMVTSGHDEHLSRDRLSKTCLFVRFFRVLLDFVSMDFFLLVSWKTLDILEILYWARWMRNCSLFCELDVQCEVSLFQYGVNEHRSLINRMRESSLRWEDKIMNSQAIFHRNKPELVF